MRRALVLLVTTVTVLTALLTAPATAAEPGRIGGTITGPSGAPADGVEVVASKWYAEHGFWGEVAGATTDGNGRYVLGDLEPGAYRLRFTDHTDRGLLTEFWDDATSVETATSIEVASGRASFGRDARLDAGGRITGTVTGPEGAPAAGVGVIAHVWNPDYFFWEPVRFARTGEDGRYDVGGLGTEHYVLEFTGGRYLTEFWNDASTIDEGRAVPVVAGRTVSGRDAQLAEGGHITGTVTARGGAPIDDISVEAYRWNQSRGFWAFVGGDRTDPDGTYDVEGLATGTYRLQFEDYQGRYLPGSAEDVPVVAGLTTPNRDAELGARLGSSPGRVTGTVTDEVSGAPLGDVAVTAYTLDDSGAWAESRTTVTDADGRYALTPLPSGTYRIGFADVTDDATTHRAEYWDDAPALASATDVTVASGPAVVGVDAALAPARTVPSTITALRDPRITGVLERGRALVVRTGRWDAPEADVAVQWYAGRTALRGADRPRLRVTRDLLARLDGRRLTARLTVTAPGFRTHRTTLQVPDRLTR